MTPFWTYFLDWAILGESMSYFEAFALIVSFGSVILIATSNREHSEEKHSIAGLSNS